jgi:hypothetical protein
MHKRSVNQSSKRKHAALPMQLRGVNEAAPVPVTAEVLVGPLVAEVRLNVSTEAQLAVR